jgi:hypothetical protein
MLEIPIPQHKQIELNRKVNRFRFYPFSAICIEMRKVYQTRFNWNALEMLETH